ncbi:hypothetical protein [uncultured Gimesia sp.]|uniref:hypothetical protein n=1 Tax=uncultured Gimesia sp. TaxID=1678688 RepID=UPI002621D972|nr:hypothetical protein [uncultured Gimesia sp.]
MKKKFTSLFVLTCLPLSLYADSIKVGETELEIPAPAGFVLTTSEMAVQAPFSQKLPALGSGTELIADYISQDEVPAVLEGKRSPGRKFISLYVSQNTRSKTVGVQDFDKIKSNTKRENHHAMNQMRDANPELFDSIREKIEQNSDGKIKLQIPQFILLKEHFETPHAISYSSLYTFKLIEDDGNKKAVICYTMTDLNPAGKMLFMLCGAPQDDLEWTRSASKAWAEAILNANPEAPEGSHLEEKSPPINLIQAGDVPKLVLATILIGIGLLYLCLKKRPSVS